ncbi:hypothetical protein GHT06_017598 [Daphnia sinensis]|uniref:HTH CENPB-type domain-containing protein n=1 Tax=Daphnia sinensis TaxID=1820382 RepID=A0AAD5L3J8_9CRUS|nr:hypothetical protein GHT06_017598 [Daphnia sinensis]
MTSHRGGSCSPSGAASPPLVGPSVPSAQIIQQELPTSSSTSSSQQQQQPKHQHHHHHQDVIMSGSVTPPLPSTSSQQKQQQHSPGGASTTTSTPSSTSSAKGAGSSGSATTATTGTTTTGAAAGTTTTPAARNKRQELSFAERIQVIQARTCGKSMRQLALQFGCGKTQILNILGQRDSYLREWDEKQAESNPHISARKRRSRRTGNEETNQKVWDWYIRQKNLGIKVTGPMLQREARSIARGLNIPNFAASNGWLDSFRRLHNIGPQSKGTSDRKSGSAVSGSGAHQGSTTPEPHPAGYASVSAAAAVASSSGGPSSYVSHHPANEPSQSSSAAPQQLLPPPPLEAFGYPVHSGGYYHHRRDEEEEEAEDEEEEDDRDIIYPQRGHLSMPQHPETELGKSFSLMANFPDASAAGSSAHHPPPVSPSAFHAAHSSSSMDDFHHHQRASYADHYDRMHHHSSSSSNSLAFSPTEVYSPTQRPTGGHHHQSPVSSHHRGNNGSRPVDPVPRDNRQMAGGSAHLTSPTFHQPASGSMFQAALVPTTTAFQQQPLETSRSIIQDGRTVRGTGGGIVVEQPQRRSVLVSTRAAAAAAAAAALENQQQPNNEEKELASTSVPGLEPLPPGLFGVLLTMVRSYGLSCLEYADDRGDIWLEIKPPSFATFRVPSFGYRTHLMRLLVNHHLSFWFEVLGHCMRNGSFRSLTCGGIDPEVVKPILNLLNGGVTVCHGRGTYIKEIENFRPKDALEEGLLSRNYFTFPDYRYRSFDCTRLIDASTGATQCNACLQPYDSAQPESPTDAIRTPSALRFQPQPHRQEQQQRQPEEQPEQHQRQQQKPQHRQHVANEPLNLSLHDPSVKQHHLAVVSPEAGKPTTGFLPVSPDGFPSIRTAVYSADQRLLLASPSVLALQPSPVQPQQRKSTPSITTIQHHHHHHYYNRIGGGTVTKKPLDQNPDDYRLAKEAAFLSLTNERDRPLAAADRSWHHIASTTTNGDNMCSKFDSRLRQGRTIQEVDLASSEESEFPADWIKQETGVLDTPQSGNGTS